VRRRKRRRRFDGGKGEIDRERRRGMKADEEGRFKTRAPGVRKEAWTMPSTAKGAASPWFEVRAQKPAMVKVRLLEVSLYAKGPRKGNACLDVAFHKLAVLLLVNNTMHQVHALRRNLI